MTQWWTGVADTVLYGVQITGVGMLLVFFTLALIILAMIVLTKLPGLKVQDPQESETALIPAAPPIAETKSQPAQALEKINVDDELAQVAAIAVALLQEQEHTSPQSRPGERLASAPTSKWKTYGRAYQLGL